MVSPAFSGRKLREYRIANDLRREVIAAEIGRSVESLTGYENGRTDPPATIVARLATALGIEPSDLFEVVEHV